MISAQIAIAFNDYRDLIRELNRLGEVPWERHTSSGLSQCTLIPTLDSLLDSPMSGWSRVSLITRYM